MHPKMLGALVSGLLSVAVLPSLAVAADAKAKPKITYQDQVAPIFRNRCNTCHNADKKKGGLTLETFGGAMEGGGSGKVVMAGDPDGSTLLNLVSHKEEPKMPPNSPKIPDAEIDMIRLWIEGGALETSGSVAVVAARPKFEFKLDPSAMGKPVGPPAMPENLLTEPVVVSPRPSAIVAMAASPWAPLVAIGGHKQVLLYDTQNNHLAGVLPFPEGSVYVLKFSRNGALVLAGGGRGGQSGLAVVWDVKTGKRVFEIGKEYDAVLAADISPDHGQVALGGPSKIVRVYSTADGQLMYEMKKHTEWVTAMEFSPDGVLLATGDRNNGLIVWEAQTGREFFDLRGHTAAITDVSWRLDSNVVASSSEDGSIKVWEMENGTAVKSLGAHGGGASSVRYAKDGRLVTTGRDHAVRLWDANGNKVLDFEAFADVALEAVFTNDESRVIAGDWTGEVRVLNVKDGKRISTLVANPAPIALRLDAARKVYNDAQAAATAATLSFTQLQAAAGQKAAMQAAAAQALAQATQDLPQKKAAADAAEKTFQTRTAEEKAAVDAQNAAQAAAQKPTADKVAAEQALAAPTVAEKAAVDALAASKTAFDTALARKAEQDKALAASAAALKTAANKAASDPAAAELAKQAAKSNELTAAIGQAGTLQASAQTKWEQAVAAKAGAVKTLEMAVAAAKMADDLLAAAKVKATALTAAKNEAAKALELARAAFKTAEPLVAAKKAEHDRIVAERAAADKAVADRKPAVDAAVASAAALKAEADMLAAEKQRADASKQAMTTTAAKGS